LMSPTARATNRGDARAGETRDATQCDD